MTSPTYAEDFQAGGGSYALVFHIAGLPWAVCSDPRIISQLDNPDTDPDAKAFRRLLFGRQTVNTPAATAHYPSDDVQMISGLDPTVGTQTISYDEGKGLKGSTWQVKLKREAHGLNYSDIRDGAVDGIYDALDLVPDPFYDGSIGTGLLSYEYREAGSDLIWATDSGLYQSIKDRLDTHSVCYLWIQSSCFAVTEDPTDNGDGTYSVNADHVRHGVFRSARERLFPSDFEGASSVIATAPTGGIVGRPANLWKIPLEDDGTIRDLDQGTGSISDYPKPILFLSGYVCPNPKGDLSDWSITCKFWLDWLDIEPPTDRPIGQLKGFRLSRQPSGLSTQVQRAHLSLLEWDASLGTPAYVETEIWLCAEGSEVYYPDLASLTSAVQSELADAIDGSSTFSDQPIESYFLTENGLEAESPAATDVFIGGPIPWILDLNFLVGYNDDIFDHSRPIWDEYSTDALDALNSSGYANGAQRLGFRLLYDNNIAAYPNSANYAPPDSFGKALYYYQFPFSRAIHAEFGTDFISGFSPWPPPRLSEWPIPEQTTAGDYRLEFQEEFNAQLLSVGSKLRIGYGSSSGFQDKLQLEGTVTSVGLGYCITSTSDTWDTIPSLKRVGDSGPSAPWWPMALMNFPDAKREDMRIDRWKVSQSQPVESTSLVKLFRGILGDESSNGADVPSRLRIYNIPDLFNDSSYNEDFRELIDWNKLEELSAGVFANSELSIPLGEDIKLNILKALNATLIHHRIRPVWGYSEAQRAWRLTFEEFGAVNAIAARNANRIIDGSSITNKQPVDTHGGTWLYRDIEGKFNYDNEGENQEIKIFNRTGIATQSGGDKTLKIDDKLLQLGEEDISKMTPIYREILGHVNFASPVTNVECTAKILPVTTVGSSCLVTSQSIHNFLTGTRSVVDAAGLITKAKISIGKNRFDIKLTVRLSPLTAQGWSGSMDIAGSSLSLVGDTVTVTGLDSEPTAAGYAGVNNGLSDLAHFGCFTWSPETNVVSASTNCTCSNYRVWIFDKNASAYYASGGSKNVWSAQILGHSTSQLVLDDINNGRCRIKLEGTISPFDDTTSKIVIFADRDNANLQPCQSFYGFLGDEFGQVTDSSGNIHRSFSWS